MRYRLIGENDYTQPLEQFLKNRGIEDANSFINMNETVLLPYQSLANISDAVSLYQKHIENKRTIGISYISDLTPRKLKAVDNYTGFRGDDPKWSSAEVIAGKCFSCMLSERTGDCINIIWLDSRSIRRLVVLRHFRALAARALEAFPDNEDVLFRMNFVNEEMASKIAPFLGGRDHFRQNGHLINAVKILKK